MAWPYLWPHHLELFHFQDPKLWNCLRSPVFWMFTPPTLHVPSGQLILWPFPACAASETAHLFSSSAQTPKTRIPVMCWITWVPSLSRPVLLSPGGLHNQILLLLPPDFWGLLHFLEAQFLTHHSFLRKFIWFPREKTRPLIWFSKASEICRFSVFPLLLFPGLLTVKLPSDWTSCCPS